MRNNNKNIEFCDQNYILLIFENKKIVNNYYYYFVVKLLGRASDHFSLINNM